MTSQHVRIRQVAVGITAIAIILFAATAAHAQTLQVCCSVPDLASLVQAIGGNNVSVTAFAKGTEDPHFIEAKPSFVKSLNQANLLVVLGLEMEAGWSPVVLQSTGMGPYCPARQATWMLRPRFDRWTFLRVLLTARWAISTPAATLITCSTRSAACRWPG